MRLLQAHQVVPSVSGGANDDIGGVERRDGPRDRVRADGGGIGTDDDDTIRVRQGAGYHPRHPGAQITGSLGPALVQRGAEPVSDFAFAIGRIIADDHPGRCGSHVGDDEAGHAPVQRGRPLVADSACQPGLDRPRPGCFRENEQRGSGRAGHPSSLPRADALRSTGPVPAGKK